MYALAGLHSSRRNVVNKMLMSIEWNREIAIRRMGMNCNSYAISFEYT